MERLTARHCGVAVIKDKSKHKEAMEKLARYEDVEEDSDMEKITTEFAEYICDNLCKYPSNVMIDQDELDDICAECKMGKFICDILNEYNSINNFVDSEVYKMMKKYSGFVRCRECQYLAYEEITGEYWCRNSHGLEFNLTENDGCTRGEIK